MRRGWSGIAVAVALVAGCASTPLAPSASPASLQTSAPTAAPVSATPVPSNPSPAPSPSGAGPICVGCTPLPAGKYTTVAFRAGTSLTIPAGWLLGEDSAGELKLNPSDNLDQKLSFFVDPIAVTNDTNIVTGVDRRPASLIKWLRSNPNVSVSLPVATSVGPGIVATSVDLKVAPTAANGDPGCPTGLVCVNLFLLRGQGFQFGYAISSDQALRFTFGTVRLGGSVHTLFVLHEVVPANSLADFAVRTRSIIATVRLQ